jgi:hypothetical protein
MTILIKTFKNPPFMKKALILVLLLTGFMVVQAQTAGKAGAQAQTAAKVDKKTKEFIIPSDTKAEFRYYGYQFPNETTKKMICFSSNRYDVAANIANCPLGSYFNTGGLKEGDRIIYLGKVGNYGKMNFIAGSGKKTIFYMPKTAYTIK